jgi:hypothetical protein
MFDSHETVSESRKDASCLAPRAIAVFSSAGTMLIMAAQLKQYTILKRVQKSIVLISTAVFSDSDARR